MKKRIFLLVLTLAFASCKKNDDEVPHPADDLPPATQVGAVMLACKVNGVPYICKGYGEVTAYYQWVNGGYSLSIRGSKQTDLVWTVEIGNHYQGNAPIEEGQTYILDGNNLGYFGGLNVLGGPNNYIESTTTTSDYTGEMTITRFDMETQIVSGTFWFDVENPWTGEKIEVREGRFDTHFSM